MNARDEGWEAGRIAERSAFEMERIRLNEEIANLEWALRFYVKGEDGGEIARAALQGDE